MSLSVCAFAHHLNGNPFYVLSCIFFPAPMSSTLISLGMCTRTYICIQAYLYDAAHHDLPPAYLSCRNISWLFYGVTFRLPPMNPVGERGASLHTPQNSKANHPCRSQQSVQLREKKTPGTSRHQQSRQADCLSSAVLLPFALKWTNLLCLLKNIVFLSLVIQTESNYSLIIHLPAWEHKWNWFGPAFWP